MKQNLPLVGYMHIMTKEKVDGRIPLLIYIEGNKIKEYITNITIGEQNNFDNLFQFDTKIDDIKIIIRKTNKGNPIVATDEIIEAYKEINNDTEYFYNKLKKISLDKVKKINHHDVQG